jgi:hypothetical protein
MSGGFWVFECTFVVNNNLLMGEVFAAASRAEMIAAMKRFFAAPRAPVMLAEVLGAYFVEGGKIDAFHDAQPFVAVEIAGQTLDFDGESLAPVIGDLEGGGVSRVYLSQGRGLAEDAEPEDEGDDDEMVLSPFRFAFDAEGFLGSLPERDGNALAADAVLELVRPIGAEGIPDHYDGDLYGPPVKIGPGWWEAEPSSTPKRFEPRARFVEDLRVPVV